jgi:hypothetical protein
MLGVPRSAFAALRRAEAESAGSVFSLGLSEEGLCYTLSSLDCQEFAAMQLGPNGRQFCDFWVPEGKIESKIGLDYVFSKS